MKSNRKMYFIIAGVLFVIRFVFLIPSLLSYGVGIDLLYALFGGIANPQVIFKSCQRGFRFTRIWA